MSELDELSLKWGSLKSWNIKSEGASLALNKYFEAGEVSASAMMQNDNEAQKAALCELIDAVNVEVVGIDLLPCPFSGKQPRWESRDGWIGSMPHQQHEFTIRGAVSRGFVSCPKRAAELWNTRAPL